MLLILGAGNTVVDKPDVVNHDLTKHRPEIDVVWDLNVFPWPWKNETFDGIQAWAVLEHLRCERLEIFNEMWRILKPGGRARIKLPAWDSAEAHDDITHYWYVTPNSLNQLDPTTARGKAYSFYTPYKWKIERAKYSNTGHSSIYFVMLKLAKAK